MLFKEYNVNVLTNTINLNFRIKDLQGSDVKRATCFDQRIKFLVGDKLMNRCNLILKILDCYFHA